MLRLDMWSWLSTWAADFAVRILCFCLPIYPSAMDTKLDEGLKVNVSDVVNVVT